MFKLTLGKYFLTNSKIHKMNPTNKIICILIFLILLCLNNNILVLSGLIILTFIMMILSKVPLVIYFKGIISLKILFIFLIVINYFFGTDLLSTLVIIIKIILAILYTSTLIYTTSTIKIISSLETLFSPLKIIGIPINKVALSLALAFRFIPIIFEQINKILKSQASRGIDFKYSNFKSKILILTSMLLPMFILSFKKADNLADVMEVRLYSFSNKRTTYSINKWSGFDDNMIILHILLLILYFIYRRVL